MAKKDIWILKQIKSHLTHLLMPIVTGNWTKQGFRDGQAMKYALKDLTI